MWLSGRWCCLGLASVAVVLGGCTSISVTPSCPDELAVGQSGTVSANEVNPGAVPTYHWEALPSNAGSFEDPASAETKFVAAKAGEVIVRLTASDGLFQVVSECRTTVVPGGDVAVSLTADPDPVAVGETVTLFCSSVGATDAVTRTLEQIDGPSVTLAPLGQGVASFEPTEVGELTFQCVGESAGGVRSQPSQTVISVVEPTNGSDNDNGNDNDGRRPPRSG